MREPTALQRLDNLMARLVEADQAGGAGLEPLALAQELGRIRAMLARGTAVRQAPGGKMHFKCEICGTISHGSSRPERCPQCGAEELVHVDLEMADVDAGPG